MNIKVRLSLKGNLQHYGKADGDVVEILLEDYVKGVVASEISNAHLEACRAQAVAARSYAYNNALHGTPISDSASSAQAFIAARTTNRAGYPNAHQGTEDTAGQILTYQGKPIGRNALYSSANNGTTKNKRYKWPDGGDVPYLVLRPDHWTWQELQRREAEGIRIRYGHGVGLSQYGIMRAAEQGVSYREMLAFYYPGTEIASTSNTDQATGGDPMSNTMAQALVKHAQKEAGGAYVFAALGEKCTPGNRRTYANRKPAHAAAITRSCPVLSGTASSCSGCRYNGKRIFDCRGFTSVMLKEVTGRYLKGGGATSQWNDDSNWEEKGTLDSLPDKPCVLFSRSSKDAKVMSHTGLYLGNDLVAQSGGYGGTGVHIGPLRRQHWTHWAIPVLLYTANGQGGGGIMTLSRGSSGAAVRTLQAALVSINYALQPTRNDPQGIDGIFGKDTEAVVKLFQLNNGLTVDGIWKEADQAKLDSVKAGAGGSAEPAPDGDAVRVTLSRDVAKALLEALKGVA